MMSTERRSQAQIARENGRQAYEAAKDDAAGELKCEVCGLNRYGREVCRECGADRDERHQAANDYSGTFPMDLSDARDWTGGSR